MGKLETDALATGITAQGNRPSGLTPASGHANPLYGSGVFRRRVHLESRPGALRAELEDCSHGFRLHIEHDGSQVTAINAEALRFPLSTCAEADRPLRDMIGCLLTANREEFQGLMPASANCTHLHDLAWWSLAHGLRNEAVRDYEIAVTDEGMQAAECSVWRNGELVLRWHALQGSVVAPQEIANRSLLRGFSAWAMPIFQGEAFEAAVMLQRGYLVAQARRFDKQAHVGMRAATHQSRHGVCFSYSTGAVERAIVTDDSERDFTNTPQLLLKFL